MTFYLGPADWEQAEEALRDKPNGTKFDKYVRDPLTGVKVEGECRSQHSFIKIEDVIYAISNRKYFEPQEGGASLVKQGLTKDGKRVGIKVKSATELDTSEGYKAGTFNGLNLAQGLRKEPNMTLKIPTFDKYIKTDSKLYIVMEWRGDTLIDVMNEHQLTLTNTQRLILCLRICLAVNRIHEQGILHCDLKSENLTATVNGNYISVEAIDFDYAKFIKPDQAFIKYHTAQGSCGLVSYEILKSFHYSVLSDSYALAVVLFFQIDITCQKLYLDYNKYLDKASAKLKKMIYFTPHLLLEQKKASIDPSLYYILTKMLETDQGLRSDPTEVILYLCKKLEKDSMLEQEIKDEVKQIRINFESKLKPVKPLLFSTHDVGFVKVTAKPMATDPLTAEPMFVEPIATKTQKRKTLF
jgi:serine/threonine protein kinase